MNAAVTAFRNCDIEEVLIGVPKGHRHLRVALKTTQGTLVFQEATLAGLLRAYVTVKTHPLLAALRLKGRELSARKAGFASHQLMEENQPAGRRRRARETPDSTESPESLEPIHADSGLIASELAALLGGA